MPLAAIALILALLGSRPQTSGEPPSLDLQIEKAASLLQSGRASQACDLYRGVLSVDASNLRAQKGMVDASERLALDARARGDSDTALRLLLGAQALAPANAKLLYDLAVLEDSMNLYADADETVVRLQGIAEPSDAKILYLAARVKLDLQQLEPAEKLMRAYLRLSPDDATAHYGMGRIFQLGQQPEEARKEFLRSLELQPQQTESYYQLGDIALAQAHYDDALAAFAKTLAGNKSHGGALTGEGIAYFRLKSYDKAVDALRQAIAISPKYETAHYYLGLSLGRLGQKAESDRELARTADLAAADNQRDAQHLRIQSLPTQDNSRAPEPPQ